MNKHINTLKQGLSPAIIIISFLTISLTTSCKSSGPDPENIAKEFLGAYLSTDFSKAASYCTDKLSGELKESIKEVDNLNEQLKKQITANAAEFVPQLGSIEKIGNGDTLIVNYSIIKNTPDSTSETNTNIITSKLSLVKDDIAGWKVLKLNK